MKNSYKNMTKEELLSKRDTLTKEYFNLRMDNVIGHLDNPLRLRTIKREIARLNTRLTEEEMGIRKEK